MNNKELIYLLVLLSKISVIYVMRYNWCLCYLNDNDIHNPVFPPLLCYTKAVAWVLISNTIVLLLFFVMALFIHAHLMGSIPFFVVISQSLEHAGISNCG